MRKGHYYSCRGTLKLSASIVSIATTPIAVKMAQAQPAAPLIFEGNIPIAEYLALRLRQLNCQMLFGVPGAPCEPVFEVAAKRGVRLAITAKRAPITIM
jgi:hypothetical protein